MRVHTCSSLSSYMQTLSSACTCTSLIDQCTLSLSLLHCVYRHPHTPSDKPCGHTPGHYYYSCCTPRSLRAQPGCEMERSTVCSVLSVRQLHHLPYMAHDTLYTYTLQWLNTTRPCKLLCRRNRKRLACLHSQQLLYKPLWSRAFLVRKYSFHPIPLLNLYTPFTASKQYTCAQYVHMTYQEL